jgi:hypothetical protein
MGALGAGSALPMAASASAIPGGALTGGAALGTGGGLSTAESIGLLGSGSKMMGGNGQQQPQNRTVIGGNQNQGQPFKLPNMPVYGRGVLG